MPRDFRLCGVDSPLLYFDQFWIETVIMFDNLGYLAIRFSQELIRLA